MFTRCVCVVTMHNITDNQASLQPCYNSMKDRDDLVTKSARSKVDYVLSSLMKTSPGEELEAKHEESLKESFIAEESVKA